MDENVKKKVLVVVAVVVIVVCGVIAYKNMFGGGGPGEVNAQVWLKCTNPDCNQSYSLSSDAFAKVQSESSIDPTILIPSQRTFKCTKCEQQTARLAQQCEKCKTVFIIGEAEDAQYSDKCPKCGYSATEEMAKQQR